MLNWGPACILFRVKIAVVAQLVERRTRNAQVKGSSPFNGFLPEASSFSPNRKDPRSDVAQLHRKIFPNRCQAWADFSRKKSFLDGMGCCFELFKCGNPKHGRGDRGQAAGKPQRSFSKSFCVPFLHQKTKRLSQQQIFVEAAARGNGLDRHRCVGRSVNQIAERPTCQNPNGKHTDLFLGCTNHQLLVIFKGKMGGEREGLRLG